MKYRFASKERLLMLGAYPDLGLHEARDRKADARKLLREGRDPPRFLFKLFATLDHLIGLLVRVFNA